MKSGTISLSDKILEVGYSTVQADIGQFGVHNVCKVVDSSHSEMIAYLFFIYVYY